MDDDHYLPTIASCHCGLVSLRVATQVGSQRLGYLLFLPTLIPSQRSKATTAISALTADNHGMLST